MQGQASRTSSTLPREDLVLTIVGARPNFMKAAPIHDAFIRAGISHEIIHTGQHFDDAMSKVFFEDLGMPEPSAYLDVGSGTHAVQTAKVMIKLDRVFDERKPRMVIVVGDVNSTMAGALVAAKRLIPLTHVEAGLRSRDRTMPEETNRLVTDAISDLLLTPSRDADANLRAEGIPDSRIVCVGNVMIDSLLSHLPRARATKAWEGLGLEPGRFGLVTLHRPSNVDEESTLSRILGALIDLSEKLPLAFPVHPRTRRKLEEFSLIGKLPNRIKLLEPLGYLEILSLLDASKLVLTDSGGLQEESTALGKPCLTLRANTERPVTVEEGTNILVHDDPARIAFESNEILLGRGKTGRIPALWDGKAAERVVQQVTRFLASA